RKFKKLIMGVLTSLTVILLLALPFTRNFDFTWLIEKYISTIDYYAYYTINAYNFWGLIGFNWKNLPAEGFASFLLNALGPVIAVILSAVLLYKKKLEKDFAVNDKYKAVYFACPALLMFSVYIFATKMHERYLFPALLFILLSYVFTSDKRFLLIFSLASFIHFLNVSYVLYLNNEYIAPDSFEIIFLSLLHLLVYFYFLYVLYSVFKKGKIVKKINLNIGRNRGSWKLFPENSKKFDKKDVIIAIAVTLFYSIFALSSVGSTKVVEKSWTPESGESVILKCDSPVDTILYLPGIGVNELNYNGSTYRASRVGANILIEYSLDGEIFMELTRAENPYVYQWQEIEAGDGFKYLRITSIGMNTTIGEIGAFYNGQQAELQLLKGEGEALLDEQEMVPAESTWENSTYFDEIYHARTAYEYIIGAEPYENTHPTLGKLFISLGILIFGMCPFGWRIVGVIFGILMLPVLYRLLRRFFESKIISASCTLIFAFDFMHYTQTRIATIDTYAVFFILLMFNFMVGFASKDIYKEKLIKLLIPLGLSGLFMGMGIASKWNVAYASLGLCFIYFIKIFVSAKENYKGNLKEVIKRPLILSLWCILFFLIIPFGIYFASFLVCTLLPQNTYDIFGRFLAYQSHMFDYHANLEATHYFASPWYEWPLDLRNIWYYGESNLSVSTEASTIVCLGNPITWWAGLGALLILAFDFIRNKTEGMAVVLLGFVSCYLPWVLISRLTFVYHYFTAVPFIIMALAYFFNKLENVKNLGKPIMNKGVLSKVKINELFALGFLAVALIMFTVFYPAISGAKSDYYYLKGLEWLSNWYFI
ncbi:MAG: phospholipid carrier-dependent glycosyltransferase, partial [Ruminococcaceae bacterium]|nr:phospholipid carrier-dependent glycosyltransferase [Oscillospiraceae bacterium]